MFTLTEPDLSPLEWGANDSSRLRHRFGDGFEDAAVQVAASIREAAPAKTGETRDSVRIERDGNQVAIKAGGVPETTKRSRSAIYDTAVLTEYGTGKEQAEPFFYPAAHGGRHTFDGAASTALAKAKEG